MTLRGLLFPSPCRFSKKVFQEAGVPSDKIVVVPEPVDTDFFNPGTVPALGPTSPRSYGIGRRAGWHSIPAVYCPRGGSHRSRQRYMTVLCVNVDPLSRAAIRCVFVKMCPQVAWPRTSSSPCSSGSSERAGMRWCPRLLKHSPRQITYDSPSARRLSRSLSWVSIA